MRYFIFTCSNGYCGCDEYFPFSTEDENITDDDLDSIGADYLYGMYSFVEPDNRCIDIDNEEEVEWYKENLEVCWEEVTEEDYESYQ